MIVLTSTDKVQVVLDAAPSLNQPALYACYRDLDASTTYTPGRGASNANGTTAVDLIGSPSSGLQRVVDHVAVCNLDIAPVTVTVQFNVSGTTYTLRRVTLQAGWSVAYHEGAGWVVANNAGIPVTNSYIPAASSVLMHAQFASGNLTTTRTVTSTNTIATYVGKAPRAMAGAYVRWRVTTAAATITWAEVALARGVVNIGANMTLTVLGYTGVSGAIASTGQKTTTVSVASGQAIAEGDDLWVLVGNQATTAAVVRAQSVADDLQAGTQGSAVVRPSLIVGSAQAFTLDGATTVAPWVAAVPF